MATEDFDSYRAYSVLSGGDKERHIPQPLPPPVEDSSNSLENYRLRSDVVLAAPWEEQFSMIVHSYLYRKDLTADAADPN